MLLSKNVPQRNEVTLASFGFYTKDEIKKISVAKIDNETAFDVTGNPTKGGLYDRRLGPHSVSERRCDTCSLSYNQCPGHIGHIELLFPAYNPIAYATIARILKSMCIACKQFRKPEREVLLIKQLLYAIDVADFDQIRILEELLFEPTKSKTKSKREMFKKLKALELKESVKQKGKEESTKDEDEEEEEPVTEDEDNDNNSDEEMDEAEEDEEAQDEDSKHYIINESWLNDVPTTREKGPLLFEKRKAIIEYLIRAKGKKCPHCKATIDFNVITGNNQIYLKYKGIKPEWVPPEVALDYITELNDNNGPLLNQIFGSSFKSKDSPDLNKKFAADMFFVEYIIVPPARFRPTQKVADMETQHSQNVSFSKIIEVNKQLAQVPKDSDTRDDQILRLRLEQQAAVNSLYDAKSARGTDLKSVKGVAQLLERKQGLLRMFMMGKRVNYAARTVISPDPLLRTNEIGIPEYFAKTLTYPEPVTTLNYKELRQAIINGPNKHPGANAIEDETGKLFYLDPESEDKRRAYAETMLSKSLTDPASVKKVYRHMRTGDVVLFNRQPSLHKPSVMAHFVRILKEDTKTFRFHYSNCATFNADFDGDEMNIHLPQNELARAEAIEIVNADNQYIVPRNGGPIRGLIQDSVVSGVKLTCRDTFLNKQDFNQLVFAACADLVPGNLVVPPPTLLKPQPMWTGKQVITAILNNLIKGEQKLFLDSTSKIKEEFWGKGSMEDKVIIRNNELLMGVLDKNQFGASSYGLVHACYELYGAKIAGLLLTALGKVFVFYLQMIGFTCGMDDLLLNSEGEKIRMNKLSEAKKVGLEVSANFANTKSKDVNEIEKGIAKRLKSEEDKNVWDGMLKQKIQPITTQILEECVPKNALKTFRDNAFSVMTISGAKGSTVNFSQISCLLGQQELEGKRVPIMASGKTLPSFDAYDPSPRAGGFIQDRFLTGVRPQEYFFHCMAGREGLIDTAVKTSRSGYLQRCLMKHLEGLRVHYDHTVRQADGSVVQFHYGEDSIDVNKTAFLEKFSFLANNYSAVLNVNQPKRTLCEQRDIDEGTKLSTVPALREKPAKKYNEQLKKNADMDPILNTYDPWHNIGSVSEKYNAELEKYVVTDSDKLFKQKKISAEHFRSLMYMRYYHSLVHPGEPVGVLAAQSLGEPSTQMTLNTFHLAGRGDVNVTLGIPRLREILMTASKKIETPIMKIAVTGNTKEAAEALARKLNPVVLMDIVQENPTLNESMKVNKELRVYNIKLKIKDQDALKKQYELNYKQIEKSIKEQDPASKKKLTLINKLIAKVIEQHIKLHPLIKKAPDNEEYGGSSSSKDERSEKDSKKKSTEETEDETATEDIEDDDDEENAEEDDDKQKNNEEPDPEEQEDDETNEVTDVSGSESDKASEKEDSKENSKKSKKSHSIKTPSKLLKGIKVIFDKDEQIIDITIRYHISIKIPIWKIIQSVVNQFEVKFVPKIKKVVTSFDNKTNQHFVQTIGVNIPAMCEYRDLADIKSLYCNDIHHILEVLGVEAARKAIAKEIDGVFSVYGISVNVRHLGLVADYMTFNGGFDAMNRLAMKSNDSPFHKMSFETAGKFLQETVLSGDFDYAKGPSTRLSLGLPVGEGTGCIDLVLPLVKTKN